MPVISLAAFPYANDTSESQEMDYRIEKSIMRPTMATAGKPQPSIHQRRSGIHARKITDAVVYDATLSSNWGLPHRADRKSRS